MKKAELLYQAEAILGEAPVWDYHQEQLLWVDIENGILNLLDPEKTTNKEIYIGRNISFVIPTCRRNFIAGLSDGIALVDRDGNDIRYISSVESNIAGNRLNDGKCDPVGRLWFGSMGLHAEKWRGALYSLVEDCKVQRHISDLTIPNGLEWSPDRKRFYFIDTAKSNVMAFEFCEETGLIRNGQTIIRIPAKLGYPDGMTVDQEGMLWIAHWGGAGVSRWNPMKGEMIDWIDVPALNVTSCCFGKRSYDVLFITSSSLDLTEKDKKQYPYSGSIFAKKLRVRGFAPSLFAESLIETN